MVRISYYYFECLDVRARRVDVHSFRRKCSDTLKRDVPEEF